MSDIELFEGLKQGNKRTIMTVYEVYYPKVISWIMKNNGGEADARDIFQETLETILLKVDKVHSSFEGMVMTISKRKWIDKLRKVSTNDKVVTAIANQNIGGSISWDDHYAESEIAYQKNQLMEKYFVQLSNLCQELLQLIKKGVDVQKIVIRLKFTNTNTLYRRKAACVERWSKLIKQDKLYPLLME